MVERVHEREAPSVADPLHLRPGFDRGGPVQYHLRTVGATGIDLGTHRSGRHHHHGADPDEARRDGDRGRVVAGRDRDHASGTLRGIEALEPKDRARTLNDPVAWRCSALA